MTDMSQLPSIIKLKQELLECEKAGASPELMIELIKSEFARIIAESERLKKHVAR